MGNPRNLQKAIFRYSLSYESCKLLINYQHNSNIKDKIKTNVHCENTFKINEQKG